MADYCFLQFLPFFWLAMLLNVTLSLTYFIVFSNIIIFVFFVFFCAYSAEIGDYNLQEHTTGYLSKLRILPNQSSEIEKQISELHQLHKYD